MKIFSCQHRTDLGGYREREPQFDYLDRSARPEARIIRGRITRWLASYPDKHQKEWIARFSSGDNIAYSSAFFELYLFMYFRRSGFHVEVAPGSNGGKLKAPDFKVAHKDVEFYLEATTAHGENEDERGVKPWKASVRKHIDTIASKQFFVSLEWQGNPTSQPAPARAACQVEQWLNTLDYAEIHQHYTTKKNFIPPSLLLRVGGTKLHILAIPKNSPRPTRGLIGAEAFGLNQVNVLPAVRRALRNKSSRYGKLDLPYVVAINVLSNTGEDEEFFDALFGTPEQVVRPDGRHHWRHGNDGGFGDLRYPRAKGVSAVLCVRDISPWTIGQEMGRQIYVYHHPHASQPLSVGIIKLAERWTENGRLCAVAGRDPRRVLSIPKDWPEPGK